MRCFLSRYSLWSVYAVSSERIQLVKRYPEEEAEAAYSDHEIRQKQEKIMDVFYQFGELMNLDPCDEKVQKAAEELHEITGGQKQVVIEILNDKYWKKAIRVAGGNGSLEFARKVMREFYQTR